MQLSDPVSTIALVGPSYASKLKILGINTIGELLYHIPARYVDYRYTTQIKNLKANEQATVVGQIVSITNVHTKTGKLMQVASLSDGENKINILWFNQPYLASSLPPGTEVSISGKVSFYQRKLVIFSPQFEKMVTEQGSIHTGRLIPIYPETAGLSSKWLRSRINFALKNIEAMIPEDYLDNETRKLWTLSALSTAITNIHLPSSPEEAEKGRLRLAFDELLKIQVENNLKKISWQKRTQSLAIKIDTKKLKKFTSTLNFTLTKSQKRSIEEIMDDLVKPHPMNRLLEGDVGSGKTVVAAAAIFMSFVSSHKSVIMAPTQILANQHFETFKKLLGPHGMKVRLVTSQMKEDIDEGDLLVGTHALLGDAIDLKKVALIVIDEQHRFGVKQRGLLAEKAVKAGKSPNILTMTATPIPRTIALTLYGDLDLSTLDEMPVGRQKVTTWLIPETKRDSAYEWIGKEITENGTQGFIVCPLIEESESVTLQEVKAVNLEIKRIKKVLPKLKIALLHGRLKAKEKDQVLADFVAKKYDILVSTPVIEVGIDIPNATIMMIETADRYGLAQLHQLRGRVGRGDKKSYCLLFTLNKGKKVNQRLKAITESHSGRELAEEDLKIRGVGEIFGIRQHGVSELKIAKWQDVDSFKNTREFAETIVENPDKYQNIFRYYKSSQPAEN